MTNAPIPPRSSKASHSAKRNQSAPRLSPRRRPEDVTPDEWQRALRKQFGSEQAFTLQALGAEPMSGDYRVGNPASDFSYRVALRGLAVGDTFCACADYATNGLGTRKHIKFALHKLQRRLRPSDHCPLPPTRQHHRSTGQETLDPDTTA